MSGIEGSPNSLYAVVSVCVQVGYVAFGSLPHKTPSHNVPILVMRLFSSPDVPLVNISDGGIGGVPFFDAEMEIRQSIGAQVRDDITCRRDFRDGTEPCRPTNA